MKIPVTIKLSELPKRKPTMTHLPEPELSAESGSPCSDWGAELEAALANAERLWKRAEAEGDVPLVVNCARCAGTYEACLNEVRRRSATDPSSTTRGERL